MSARTSEQYLQGLKENAAEVYLEGERVLDVTNHPHLKGGIASVGQLLDMQHEPSLIDEMTYVSPTSGERVGLSHIMPKTLGDLEKRRVMMTHWARASCGMMGRTPDFLNTAIMSMAAASEYCGQNRPEFKKNIERYYEHVRENDLVLTHTLVNLQRSRTPGTTPLEDRTDVALSVVKEKDNGILVKGARVLATLGPLADEITVYPARTHMISSDSEGKYAFGFAIPCNTQGVRFLCRESFDTGHSHFDHPLGSRYEEMDAVVFFDDVLVPWERVFLYGDVDMCNNWAGKTHRNSHTGHQVVTKNVIKCEFVLGLASLMVETLGSGQISQVQQLMAEIIENLEITKACLRSSEADAALDEWGIMCPSYTPLLVARKRFIEMYPRMAEILHLLGSSSLMALPSEADMNGPLGSYINQYLETDTATADERVRLFRLAWDTCCSSFSARQILYERYFGGDALRNGIMLDNIYDKSPMTTFVWDFLYQE